MSGRGAGMASLGGTAGGLLGYAFALFALGTFDPEELETLRLALRLRRA